MPCTDYSGLYGTNSRPQSEADGGERLRFSDAEFVVRASADTTGGAFTIIEEYAPLDTPLHVHKNEDELWYVLEGNTSSRSATTSFMSVPARQCSRLAAFPMPSGEWCRELDAS